LRAGSPLPAIALGAEGVVGGRGDGAVGGTSGMRFSEGCLNQIEKFSVSFFLSNFLFLRVQKTKVG
jgi:hypothetical protein